MTESSDSKAPSMLFDQSSSDGNSGLGDRYVDTHAVVERLPVGVLVCALNANATIDALFLNKFARELFGLDDFTSFPLALDSIWANAENHQLSGQIIETFQSRRQGSFEWTVKVGSVERFLSSQLIPLRNKQHEVLQVICTVEDQTAEKLAERNLLHHAFHDALTGQPNRVLFRNKLEEAVGEVQRNEGEHGVAVLIINIDRFQQINDSFGHSAGDRFLVALAATLRRCIRSHDTLSRLSGDEFAILVPRCRDLEEVESISARIHDAMRLPYDLDGNEVYSSVSVGIATTLSSSTHPEDLIRDADFAMHRAKVKGKARTEIYRRDTHHRARSQFHLETELRRAVDRDEVELYYQPLISLQDGMVRGFEALTRWTHEDRGPVSPAEFIPLAEETGVIVNLGRWAMNKACAQVRYWIDTYGEEIARPVNVNVSGIQFARDDIIDMIDDALNRHKIPGSFIKIELTESAIMANPNRIAGILQDVRERGVLVALDDFGAGYSSLNYLHQFPIDVIKIDRSFINQMKPGNQTFAILRMISMLADNLGHEIVAEGIEAPNQIEMLRDLNFHTAQGFYYSRPVSHREASKLLTDTPQWLQ